MTAASVAVLIVDDQPLIRSALRALLDTTSGVTVVGEAGDGEQALRAVVQHEPQVVLMDIRMPRMDGLEATRLIRERHPQVEVVILTTFDEDAYVEEAIRAGAAGFLLKDGDADELVRGIHVAASGEALMAPTTLRRLMGRMSHSPRLDQSADAAVARLTEREREVLVCAARGLNNAEIAAALSIGETTVKTHIGSILSKMGARDRVQAVALAYRGGLVSTTEG